MVLQRLKVPGCLRIVFGRLGSGIRSPGLGELDAVNLLGTEGVGLALDIDALLGLDRSRSIRESRMASSSISWRIYQHIIRHFEHLSTNLFNVLVNLRSMLIRTRV
jgi:hypothetical protein